MNRFYPRQNVNKLVRVFLEPEPYRVTHDSDIWKQNINKQEYFLYNLNMLRNFSDQVYLFFRQILTC